MRTHRPVRARALAAVVLTSATLGALATTSAVAGATTLSATAASCSDVDVVFARGTTEAPGFGQVGTPFTASVATALPGRTVSTYAVVYDANLSQTSAAPGSTDLVRHVSAVSAACPGTRFVLSGYSQGAAVVDKALGVTVNDGAGPGTALPAALSGRVAAAVVFGNPLGRQRQTIATASPTYGSRSKDYCNTGDPVCGGGANVFAHLAYASNGSAAAGGQFAASLVLAPSTR